MNKKIFIFWVAAVTLITPAYTMNSTQGASLKSTLDRTAETNSTDDNNGEDDGGDTTDFTDDSDSDSDSDSDWLLPSRNSACASAAAYVGSDSDEDLVLPHGDGACEFPTVGSDSDDEKDAKQQRMHDSETLSAQFDRLGISGSRADFPRPPHVADRGVLVVESLDYRRELQKLLAVANERLGLCRGIVDVTGTTAVVGDLHGDFETFKKIIGYFCPLLDRNVLNHVVFLGDIMDRGNSSAMTLLELVRFFNKYPGRVHIIRGNHETRDMFERHDANAYPARDDPYFNYVPRESLYKFFDSLPYAAIINNTTLAVHGGIPQKEHWESFRSGVKSPEGSDGFNSCILQVLWSDYNDLLDFETAGSYIRFGSMRGGHTLAFNEAAAKEFLTFMGLKYMIRGHQPDLGNFHQSPNKIITTVFSALENQGFDLNLFGAKTALIFKDREPQELATFFMF